jgi:integrase
MPRSADMQYLERHGRLYRVTFNVPSDLRKELGTKLKRSLETDSLSIANERKWDVIKEFRRLIEQTRGVASGDKSALIREAVEVAHQTQRSMGKEQPDLHRDLQARSYEILGAPVRTEVDDNGQAFEVHAPEKIALLKAYTQVALGAALPIRIRYDQYLAKITEDGLKPRTIDDDTRVVDILERWMRKNEIPDDLSAVTTKVAKNFARDLATFDRVIGPVTRKKYISRLRQYWEHLIYEEDVEYNPFLAVKIVIRKTPREEKERPFTEDEVRRLLVGASKRHLRDLMMIGALSGARLDAIVDLRVKDCVDGCFTFKPQKGEDGSRDVPIHPALREIVEFRCKGKSPEDWLFPEFPPPKKTRSLKEHSSQATKLFTAYRRRIGVNEVLPGKRRSLVNFHSFRRWFITKAERAGQDDNIIAAVVGHKDGGITLDRYSAGPEMKQARRCVEAVKLPPLGSEPVPEPRAVTPRRRPLQTGTDLGR